MFRLDDGGRMLADVQLSVNDIKSTMGDLKSTVASLSRQRLDPCFGAFPAIYLELRLPFWTASRHSTSLRVKRLAQASAVESGFHDLALESVPVTDGGPKTWNGEPPHIRPG
jgi:hypothetical protein